MKFPRVVYAIYPLNENGKIAGVYVGSTFDFKRRAYLHMHKNPASRQPFQELMIKNGFYYQTFNIINSFDEAHLEYDWMDFFKKNGVVVFNQRTDFHSPDYRRITEPSIPKWTGEGVIWQYVTS